HFFRRARGVCSPVFLCSEVSMRLPRRFDGRFGVWTLSSVLLIFSACSVEEQLNRRRAGNTDASAELAAVASGGNFVANGSFESGMTGWSFKVANKAKAKQTSDAKEHVDGSFSQSINVTAATKNSWDVQLISSVFPLKAGGTVTISFQAKASSNR